MQQANLNNTSDLDLEQGSPQRRARQAIGKLEKDLQRVPHAPREIMQVSVTMYVLIDLFIALHYATTRKLQIVLCKAITEGARRMSARAKREQSP